MISPPLLGTFISFYQPPLLFLHLVAVDMESKKVAALANKEATIGTTASEECFLLCKDGKLQGRNPGMANFPPKRGEIKKKILASIFVSLKPSKKSSSDSGKS